MKQVKHLLIGGGMSAAAAANAIREADPQGSILMISAEAEPPYARPPLSKDLWRDGDLRSIWRKLPEDGFELQLESRAVGLDPGQHLVRDDHGEEYQYARLLLATGGRPRRLEGADDVSFFRTLEDYRRLRKQADELERFAVIGGGFIGSELAAALAIQGKQVVQVFPEQHIGALMFPADLAQDLERIYAEHGVDIKAGELVSGVERSGDELLVHTDRGEYGVQAAVGGVGILTNDDLARSGGLKVREGIVVDEHLQTSAPDIYAAGDVVEFFQHELGTYRVVEHEDNALSMGRQAGLAMAGEDAAYDHLPYFYSDLFDQGYEALGETSKDLETVSVWQEPFRKGIVYYLAEGHVRGVLLWNVWERRQQARALIAREGTVTRGELENAPLDELAQLEKAA
jgi:3-phenylpropionate/trans-cinnamate dioxygenase ferredoxin reductase subunit